MRCAAIGGLCVAGIVLAGCLKGESVEAGKTGRTSGQPSPNRLMVIARTPEGCTIYGVVVMGGVTGRAIVCPAGYSGGVSQ